jgi:hypothetical protein
VKASKATGVDLIKNPDLAVRPDLAAIIRFDGMREGWFTGRKLSDYITSSKADYKGCQADHQRHRPGATSPPTP